MLEYQTDFLCPSTEVDMLLFKIKTLTQELADVQRALFQRNDHLAHRVFRLEKELEMYKVADGASLIS
jgi:hypothetical protein